MVTGSQTESDIIQRPPPPPFVGGNYTIPTLRWRLNLCLFWSVFPHDPHIIRVSPSVWLTSAAFVDWSPGHMSCACLRQGTSFRMKIEATINHCSIFHLVVYLHCWTQTRIPTWIRTPNPMATLHCTEHITSNNRPFDCPIICTDIYSQCYFAHWHLQQCLIQSSLLVNQDAIFVDDC